MRRMSEAEFVQRAGDVLRDEDQRQRLYELKSTRLQLYVAVGIMLVHRAHYLGANYRVIGQYSETIFELIGDKTRHADVLVAMSRKHRLHRSDRSIGAGGNAGWVVTLTPPAELVTLAEEVSPWLDLKPATNEEVLPDPAQRARAIVRGIQREGAAVLAEVHGLLEKALKDGDNASM